MSKRIKQLDYGDEDQKAGTVKLQASKVSRLRTKHEEVVTWLTQA